MTMRITNINQKTKKGVHYLHERLRDPLLTALTAMLAVLLFVVAPLQASGVLAAHWFGIAFGLMLVAVVLIVSRSVIAIAFIFVAIVVLAETRSDSRRLVERSGFAARRC